MNMQKFMEVMTKYNGHKKQFGVMDCHTFVYEIYEPEAMKCVGGKYKTLIGGIRAASKYLGDNCLYNILMNTLDYTLIDNPRMIQTGDIIIHKENRYDVYVCVEYGKAFGVLAGDIFGVCNTVELNNHYIIRHK